MTRTVNFDFYVKGTGTGAGDLNIIRKRAFISQTDGNSLPDTITL